MKPFLKYLLASLVIVLTAALIAVTALQADRHRARTACRHVLIENRSTAGQRFIPDEDVLKEVERGFGTLYGVPLESLDLHAIEQIFDKKSAVKKSEVFVSYPDSSLHIRIEERIPRLRFQTASGGFYCDREGTLFPLQTHYTAWVPVVDGHLPIDCWWNVGPKGRRWLEDILSLTEYMSGESRWNQRCTQIHVERDGGIRLVFDNWEEIFLIGDCRGLDAKFRRIEQYLCSIKPVCGKQYKSVNVRFDGQIICK